MDKPLRPGFVRWARECLTTLGASGGRLVDINAEAAYGKYATFPADADSDLRAAEALGWIVRGAACPTLSQRVFVGLERRSGSSFPMEYRSGWFWMPASGEKGAEFRAWVKAEEARLFGEHRCAHETCHVRVERAGAFCGRTH